jgi:hypothetical protein
LNVTLIAGFLALVLVLVEFVRYENSQHCAVDEMKNMIDAMKSQYSKEHANTDPELMEIARWMYAHLPEAQSTCSLKYRFDPLFSIRCRAQPRRLPTPCVMLDTRRDRF